MAHSHEHHSSSFPTGPVAWLVCAALGLLLGVLWGVAMPPAPAAAHDDAHELPKVIETTRDGARFERLPDMTAVPLGAPLEAGTEPAEGPRPASVEQQMAEGGHGGEHGGRLPVPIVLVAPFALLLASIAVMPFIAGRWWHARYPEVAFALGGLVAGYYLRAMGHDGRHDLLHAAIEFYSFLALVGGLFVVSGGIYVNVSARGRPLVNTALLGAGAVLANFVGTTGASMLLIRPFMRINEGRLRPVHVVMFIFIVSNCGGCLTPIGDPPLYLGYLKGVPFAWTLWNLWPMFLVCVGLLLVVFFVIDSAIGPGVGVQTLSSAAERESRAAQPTDVPVLSGRPAMIGLVLLVAGVFIDPMLKKHAGITGIPIGATFQILVAAAAYRLAAPSIHRANAFNFGPVKEVGCLFAGIFMTMVPALGYLAANGSRLGLETPTQFYFLTGTLSAVLDNAPTYLNFGQTALGVLHLPLSPEGLHRFITGTFEVVHADGTSVRFEGQRVLEAISLGAVFFGAMTYIGNGPNFMVKAIAESSGVKMPSFFGYLLLACLILLPVLVVVWALFIAAFAPLAG